MDHPGKLSSMVVDCFDLILKGFHVLSLFLDHVVMYYLCFQFQVSNKPDREETLSRIPVEQEEETAFQSSFFDSIFIVDIFSIFFF